MKKILKYSIFIPALLQAAVVFAAQDDGAASNNNDVTPAPYEENLRRWQSMSEEQREAIRQKVRTMDAAEKITIFENAGQFRRLPQEEQDRIRGNFRKFKELPQEKREFLREKGRRFQNFSSEERARLRRGIRERIGGPGINPQNHPEFQSSHGAGLKQPGNFGNRFGPRSSPEMNRENGPGPQGRPDRRPWIDRDNNPPGPVGGPGTNWRYRPCPQDRQGASSNYRPKVNKDNYPPGFRGDPAMNRGKIPFSDTDTGINPDKKLPKGRPPAGRWQKGGAGKRK